MLDMLSIAVVSVNIVINYSVFVLFDQHDNDAAAFHLSLTFTLLLLLLLLSSII